MTNTSFLDKIATVLIQNYSDKLSNTIVVLPNKRAKVFLIEALKKAIPQFYGNDAAKEEGYVRIINEKQFNPM